MRFLYNNTWFMYANDGNSPEKLAAAINNLSNNHGVQFKTEDGEAESGYTRIFLPTNNSKKPDYKVLDASAYNDYLPLDVALREIHVRLGLAQPDLRDTAPDFKVPDFKLPEFKLR